jgi:hypothetical protein
MQKRRPDKINDPLQSTETITLVRELSDQQIEIIKNNQEFGGEIVAQRLEKLRNAVWGSKRTKKPFEEDKQKEVFSDVIKGLNPAQKEQLLSSYARMGHLYEIASLSARSNYFKGIQANPQDAIPDSIADLPNKQDYDNVGKLVEKLNHPVFEIVMTAHPTNVNSLGSMQAQRKINKALENHNQEELTEALIRYQQTPLLKETIKDGKKTTENLTVREETQTALYFLSNIYEDLPRIYGNYDTALEKHARNTNSSYDPTALNLKLKFGSWGSSGDKDGNNSVTAETTLEAIALHTQAILTHYHNDLEKIPHLSKWKNKFSEALTELNPLTEEIAKLREDAKKEQKDSNSTPEKLNERFDKLSGRLAEIRSSLDGKGFESALNESAKNDTQEGKDSLNLLRRFRTFGFNFSKIEYRETAKEYSRVVGELVDGYKDLTPEQKAVKLTELLQKPGKVARLFEDKKSQIIKGAGKSYSKESASPIAYHTLKRMALARDFGDMVKDNVLAECGQLESSKNGVALSDKEKESKIKDQGLANMLEAQFLQHAVAKNGNRAKLGIVPLFEEPDTLKNIEKIMEAAYQNPVYKQHLQDIRNANEDRSTQQVQIAHSDNAKRSGLQAARAYIHTAHHKMRELGKKYPDIQTQFFEGGSISDAYRNGVRALSKTIDAFALHDFAKFTFQGGDLLNFFNHPSSVERLFDNAVSHQARMLEDGNPADGESKKWGTRVRNSQGNTPNEEIEKNVNRALRQTLGDYQNLDLNPSAMPVLLAALDYKKVTRDSNASSRAGERTNTVFAKAEAKLGSVHTAQNTIEDVTFRPIDINDIRTIGFSKTWQGAGIVPSWVGSLELKDHLDTVFKKKDIKDVGDSKRTHIPISPLTPKTLKEIYDHSPTFHDGQDRSAFAIALTDIDSAKKIANNKLLSASDEYRDSGTFYLDRIEKTYRAAAELAYSAVAGKHLHASNLDNKRIRDKMIDALPNLKDDIINKINYRAALLHWQIEHPELFESQHMGRTAQAAKDTVEHGRWLGASDPSTTKHYKEHIAQHTRQR